MRIRAFSVLVVVTAVLAAVSAQAGVLSAGLERQMEPMADHEELKVLIVMRDQFPTIAMDKALRDAVTPLKERHRTMITSLRQTAESTQKDLLGELSARKANKATGGVRGYTSHWIVNSVVLVADVAVIRELALRDDIEVIEADLVPELIDPVLNKPVATSEDGPGKVDIVAPGVQAINAPRVWHELGITGAGTLVANMDSGVDGNHEALGPRWRGTVAPASECWSDDGGVGSPDFPVDEHGHGTHTMGTITGATATDTVGVAPGAQWIASNAIWAGLDLDNAVIAGFEFFTDPDGDPDTMDDVPDVVQNSWGVTAGGGAYVECDSRWWEVIDNCEAAGVVVVFSAGNEGPGMETLRSPGDRATTATNCFSVGSGGNIAPYPVSSFSSRGPSACGGPFATKPEVIAPGENVLSTLPGNQYGYMDGTSMAGPHVAGIVALMRQANPDLDVVSIKEIIMSTAIDLGQAGDDNHSGHGMVDAYAAVLAAFNDVGKVSGTVRDADTMQPLEGFEVSTNAGFTSMTTGSDGRYVLSMRAGAYDILATGFSYLDNAESLVLTAGDSLTVDFLMVQQPQGILSGKVYGPDGMPIEGAQVTAVGIPQAPAVSDSAGSYELSLPVQEGNAYEVMATAPDLAYEILYLGMEGDVTLDFHLPTLMAEGFESGSFLSLPWQMGGDAPMVIDPSEAYEGIFSARSGSIDDNETSELSLDYYVVGQGAISFWLKIESEESYDGLIFYVDGQWIKSWSGLGNWEYYSYSVPMGQHEFKWVYLKDSNVSVQRDGVWIDRIEFPGTGIEPFPELQTSQPNLSMNLNPGWADSTSLVVTNTGGYRLDYSITIDPFQVMNGVTAKTLIAENPSRLIQDGSILAGAKADAEPWASASPTAGFLHPGISRSISVNFSSVGMDHGTYYSLMSIHSNDPSQPLKTVPLVLTVGGVSGTGDLVRVPEVEMLGAVPNPFNPATDIAFSLPSEANVRLEIFDVSGRLVRNLVSGSRSAGVHNERWNGKDSSGKDVASGAYFARLQVGSVSEIQSMLLVR